MDDDATLEIVLAHLDGYVRVKLRGDLDYPNVVAQNEALQAVTDLRETVVIDLSEAGFIDTGGLAALIAITRSHDGPIAVEGASRAHRRLFKMTALDTVFELRD